MQPRKILTQTEWNVPINISFAVSPKSLSIRSFISLAALFVKVIAKIFQGRICFSEIIYAILFTSTVVFPLPAPASTRTGPSVANTASFCLSLSLSNILFIKCSPKIVFILLYHNNEGD